jgi:hypothetical protein
MAEGTCSVDGCGRVGKLKRGWCSRCYQRWWNHGEPTTCLDTTDLTPEQRFLRLSRLVASGCVEWMGTRTAKGYGMFKDGKSISAHRWAYLHWVGPIPDEMQLDHLCRNRACVNPWHLEPVTNRENQRRSPLAPQNRSHCIHGHEFTPENTILTATRYGGTGRACRACANARNREYLARKRAERCA